MSAPLDGGGIWATPRAVASPDNWADAAFFDDEPVPFAHPQPVASAPATPPAEPAAPPPAPVVPAPAAAGGVVDELVSALRERPGSRWDARRAEPALPSSALTDAFPSIESSPDPVWLLTKDETPMLLVEDDGRAHVPAPEQTSLDLNDVVSVLGGGVEELAGLLDFGIAPTIARVRQVRRAGEREAQRAAADTAVALPPLLRVTRRSLAAATVAAAAAEAEAQARAVAETEAIAAAEAAAEARIAAQIAAEKAEREPAADETAAVPSEEAASSDGPADALAVVGRAATEIVASEGTEPAAAPAPAGRRGLRAAARAAEPAAAITAGSAVDATPELAIDAGPRPESAGTRGRSAAASDAAPSRRSRRTPTSPEDAALIGIPAAAIDRITGLIARARADVDEAQRLADAHADRALHARVSDARAALDEAQALGAYVLRDAPRGAEPS